MSGLGRSLPRHHCGARARRLPGDERDARHARVVHLPILQEEGVHCQERQVHIHSEVGLIQVLLTRAVRCRDVLGVAAACRVRFFGK